MKLKNVFINFKRKIMQNLVKFLPLFRGGKKTVKNRVIDFCKVEFTSFPQ